MEKFIDSLVDNKSIKNKIVALYMKLVDYKYFTSIEYAYSDYPKHIGCNMTISAPHMHAFALDVLKPWEHKNGKTLDVGCGSGYLTTVMSLMSNGIVYGIDNKIEMIEL